MIPYLLEFVSFIEHDRRHKGSVKSKAYTTIVELARFQRHHRHRDYPKTPVVDYCLPWNLDVDVVSTMMQRHDSFQQDIEL